MKTIGLKKIILLIIILIIPFLVLTQTFSNTTVSTYNTWNTSNSWATALSRTIVVSGLATSLSNTASGTVLQQVNLTLGDGVNTGLNLSTYAIRIKSPIGTIINISSAGGINATSIRDLNIKYRDDAILNFPTSSLQQPFDIGYYRVTTSSSFSNVNGENPNGNWTLEIIEGTSTEIAFQKVELVFGTPFTYEDITGSSANDACSTPQCMSTGTILKATISGYSGNATDPNVGTPYPGGCQWNGAKNNSAWFYFTANATTAKITISGVSASIQSLCVNASNQCVAGSQTVPTGGCPIDAVNDTYLSPRYTGTSGSAYNQQFNLSGLTSGNVYALVIDGTGGAISPLYIEMSGSTGSCGVVLNSDLFFVSGISECDENQIFWNTSNDKIDYFIIEESNNGQLYSSVDQVSANAKKYHYSLPIKNVLPVYYYKIKAVDKDGNEVESKILTIKNKCLNDNILLSGNEIYLRGFENMQSIEIYDLQGRKVIESNSDKLDVSMLSNSIYNIVVKANGEYYTNKILKQ